MPSIIQALAVRTRLMPQCPLLVKTGKQRPYALLLNCLDMALKSMSKRKVLPVTAALTAAHPTLFA